MRVTFLGTGTSHGIPVIGCRCETCLSDDPRDRRWRPSIFLELDDGFRVLVDASTDLRAQALRFDVTRVDAILFTHSHADHILGLDEVRVYNYWQRTPLPCFGDARTIGDVRRTFAYIFDDGMAEGGGVPQVTTFVLAGPFTLGRTEVMPVPIFHGTRPILGYRIGGFAYLTDCSSIPDASWPLLTGVEVLVLDALRHRPHPTHLSVQQAVELAARLSPRQTYFTHMCHDLPHAATCRALPAGVELAYDGLVIELATHPARGAAHVQRSGA